MGTDPERRACLERVAAGLWALALEAGARALPLALGLTVGACAIEVHLQVPSPELVIPEGLDLDGPDLDDLLEQLAQPRAPTDEAGDESEHSELPEGPPTPYITGPVANVFTKTFETWELWGIGDHRACSMAPPKTAIAATEEAFESHPACPGTAGTKRAACWDRATS